MRNILWIMPVMLLFAACTLRDWVKEGKTDSEMEMDRYDCQVNKSPDIERCMEQKGYTKVKK